MLSAGSNLGPYRIIEPVGRGGMASVFKAYEASLDRYVALKVLPPEFLHDPTFAERFRREAQTVARLEHPQIIPIFAYDIDTATGTPWMAMRLIAGGSLSQRIKRGRLAPLESARILKDVADALDYAHTAGVIHRDVKPQNVLLDDAGRVYLADFGIAKMVESTAHMTQTGMITGTPQYMAPEQALGKSIDKSIDIYALGIVAYELFTGRVPFSADTPVAVLMKQASEPMPLPPVSEVREEVTRAILRATAKDPAGRWPTASAFARAVSAATTSMEPIGETSQMSALSAETVQGITRQTLQSSPRSGGSASDVRGKPGEPTRPAGSGMALAAIVLLALGLLGATVTFFGYRYFQPTRSAELYPPLPSPVTAPATPEATAVAVPATPAPAEIPATPQAIPETTSRAEIATAQGATPRDFREPPTPAERRALAMATSGREPLNRRERLAAMAEGRRRLGGPGPRERPATGEEEGPISPRAERESRTRITLEIEASQPSTGNQISALYAQVMIDNRPYRDFVIRFTGSNTFARWKSTQNIVLEDIPLTASEITLVVATDPGLDQERMEGSLRLSLQGEENKLSAVVRFYNQFDKSVKFR